MHRHVLLFFFFFNDTATTEIYTLSLHDALPILAQEAEVVIEMLDDIEQRDQVEREVVPGKRLERAAEGVRETALPTEIDGERRSVGPVGLEAARQRLEDGARTAADVEDARAGRELDPPVDHVLDDPQARDAPPVGLLDLIDRPTEDLVH